MQKRALVLMILTLLLLVSCGSKTVGKRVSLPELSGKGGGITGAVAGVANEAAPDGSIGKSAAETLRDIKSGDSPAALTNNSKEGNFYPPIQTTASGREALAEKTRALFQKEVYEPKVTASGQFGARYHDSSGQTTNLPDNYTNTGSPGDN